MNLNPSKEKRESNLLIVMILMFNSCLFFTYKCIMSSIIRFNSLPESNQIFGTVKLVRVFSASFPTFEHQRKVRNETLICSSFLFTNALNSRRPIY